MATQLQSAPNGANGRSLKDDESTAVNGTSTASSMPCPDPSAHNKTKKSTLQDHASAAALYSTNPVKATNNHSRDVHLLGPDGKLSSASAATSLKYARAQDLPSYPIVGIETQNSGLTAASLAHANQKSPSYPKVESSSAAGKAALLAAGYKMDPLWQPEASAAGSKAALLAHRDGAKVNLWKPEASADGNSAATIAMKKQGLSPQVDYGHTDDGRKRALVAATGAVSTSNRRRAQSTPAHPPLYPDSENSARNALNAATLVHASSMRKKAQPAPAARDSNRLGSGAMEAARIQHAKSISRDMYTEHPPIRWDVEEKQHQAALRASAISMANQMIEVQKKHPELTGPSQAQSGASVAHGQHQGITSEEDLREQAKRYIGIQEAAQKLAAERLAKIGYDENAAYRSYYGYGNEKPSSRSKLSMRRGRRRASSNPEPQDSSSDDEFRSRRIRTQMSQLNKSLADVDAKRANDQKGLMAAAQRKVQAQMQGMDKKIFDETGKMSPAMIEEWDAKARARATAASEARMENHGRIHLGNGKYMDQADIDAVALARIQPTLDEINEKTEKRRAEEEERRIEMEAQKREQLKEKERAAEIKAEEKRAKDEERRVAKTQSSEEKAAKRQEKEAEKEKKAEEKRMAKEEKRKSREAPKPIISAPIPTSIEDGTTSPTSHEEALAAAGAEVENGNDDLYRDPTPAARHSTDDAAAEPTSATSPTSPASPTSPTADATSPKEGSKGFKGFLSKFKRRSKHSGDHQPGFIGGASLRASSGPTSKDEAPTSPRATDGPLTSNPLPSSSTRPSDSRRYSDVSSLSSGPASRGRSPERIETKDTKISGGSAGTEFEEARDDFDEKLAPPPSFTSESNAGRKGSPNRDSRFHEVGI
ncbi:hypothetical protein BDV96DRAFT_580445 [Lophiotrema nucula]|uniref:Eisosome protein 1 n=1 Tax=Lophiotrema nucula TaxID=690887 RepID=A0A6A5YZF7_9PLEO|nr:hypothetical protein BDV96DRAFT_580445 [Lophiotrema nucula]